LGGRTAVSTTRVAVIISLPPSFVDFRASDLAASTMMMRATSEKLFEKPSSAPIEAASHSSISMIAQNRLQ
jgi:hypothetical protein